MKQRIWYGFVKMMIYLLVIAAVYPILFIGLVMITTVVSGKGLSEYAACLENDSAAYVIAAATLEFAVLTMLQQHITRQQDRSLEFPNICIDCCELYTKQERVLGRLMGSGQYKRGVVIKIISREMFPVYYTPKIYHAWVGREVIKSEGSIQKMNVLSSDFRQNQGNAIWELQVERLEWLIEAARRNQEAKVQALTFYFDVGWENQLLPWYRRKLSRIYMRWILYLEDSGERTDYGCDFKVKGLEIRGFGTGIAKVQKKMGES